VTANVDEIRTLADLEALQERLSVAGVKAARSELEGLYRSDNVPEELRSLVRTTLYGTQRDVAEAIKREIFSCKDVPPLQ
jgi:hypothetical protein